MKNIFNTLFLTLLVFSSLAQVEQKTKQNTNLSPKITENQYSIPEPTTTIEKTEVLKPNRAIIKKEANVRSLAIPIKATRNTETIVKNEVIIAIDPSKSDLDNTLSLIEEKENVNKYNPSLMETAKYKELLSEISVYKNRFNNSVKAKGIENCSTKEQNYFLAFLKEEGKEDEYKSSISKIK